MTIANRNRESVEAGFTLIELLIVVVILGLLAAISIPKFGEVRVKAHVAAVESEGRILYAALEEFHGKFMAYPNASSSPAFDIVSYEPLRSEVEYSGHPNELLLNGQADSYDSPDDQGNNQEFWIQMSLRIDPRYQIVVAISDDAPLGNGDWMQGVYTFYDGNLVGGPGT